MTAIFGVLRRDATPANLDLEAMQLALAAWGEDAGSSWSENTVGLGQHLRRITPESVFETMPVHVCGGLVSVVASGRLDNRNELCAAFGLDAATRVVTPDGKLIALAFERWGKDCVHHLLGDWSFAAYNHQTQSFMVARDHYGNTGLYYCLTEKCFAFSSGIEGLLALEVVPQDLNDQKIAEMLILWLREGENTVYQNIKCLPPAHLLTFENNQFKLERYWKLEDTPTLRLRSSLEYAEGLQNIFRTAVRDRMRSNLPIASTLSSGLDSGSVTVLAAEYAKEQQQTITAFTSVPALEVDHPSEHNDDNEWDLAHQTASFAGNVNHLAILDTNTSPIAAVTHSQRILQRPNFIAGNNHWIDAMLKQARSSGFGVLLTGQCGNGAASFSGGSFPTWQALRQWRLGLAKHAFSSAVLAQGGLTKALFAEVLSPLMLSSKTLTARVSGSRFENPEWAGYSAISPALIQRLNLLEQINAADWIANEIHAFNPKQQMMQTLLPDKQFVGSIWHCYSGMYGIEVRDPTMDKRLLEFCAGVPLEQFVGGGYSRFLIRRAMQGLLPPKVQWNTKRGVQGADLNARLRQAASEVNTALSELKAKPIVAVYLDVNRLEIAWKRVQQQQAAKMDGLILLRGISVGLFLTQFKA